LKKENVSQHQKLEDAENNQIQSEKKVIQSELKLNQSEIKLKDANDTKTLLNNRLYNITQQWKEIHSPYGNLPIDFSNLLAIFPLSMTIGFFICSIFLFTSIRLRSIIHKQYNKSKQKEENIKNLPIYFIAPLWIDPVNPEQNKILQFLVLLLPFVIFLSSTIMILYSWNYGPSEPFATASLISENFYYWLYILCFGIFIYSYWHIISEVKNYYNRL
jgi:TRAP-type C4-dicarboxylate transport system permease small subunit